MTWSLKWIHTVIIFRYEYQFNQINNKTFSQLKNDKTFFFIEKHENLFDLVFVPSSSQRPCSIISYEDWNRRLKLFNRQWLHLILWKIGWEKKLKLIVNFRCSEEVTESSCRKINSNHFFCDTQFFVHFPKTRVNDFRWVLNFLNWPSRSSEGMK